MDRHDELVLLQKTAWVSGIAYGYLPSVKVMLGQESIVYRFSRNKRLVYSILNVLLSTKVVLTKNTSYWIGFATPNTYS